jgi:CRISPR system Cascade subunit CasE
MNALHLIRLPVHPPRLLRFAMEHGIAQQDETLGYTLHAWLTALFGDQSPKPFRYLEPRNEVLAYSRLDAASLLARAEEMGSLPALSALDAGGVVSKVMPTEWKTGKRLHLEALTCPVSRQGDEEKDIYLRALDQSGASAPTRAEVYQQWFIRQWQDVLHCDQVELLGMTARSRLLRRARNGKNRLRTVERPQAWFGADVVILDPKRFAEMLARGIGRHRAFGFGMVLLSPPQ